MLSLAGWVLLRLWRSLFSAPIPALPPGPLLASPMYVVAGKPLDQSILSYEHWREDYDDGTLCVPSISSDFPEEYFRSLVRDHPDVASLAIAGNLFFSPDCTTMILENLRSLNSLTSLHYVANHCVTRAAHAVTSFSDSGAAALKALVEEQRLVHLSLAMNRMHVSTNSFIMSFQRSRSLTSLDLSGNTFSTTQLGPFAEFMNDLPLRYLNLSQTEMSDLGLTLLSGAIAKNDTLESLDLGGNLFWKVGVMELFESLRGNSRLKKLSLTGNDIKGCDFLKLDAATALLDLELNCCKLFGEDLQNWSYLLRHNRSIRRLDLSANIICMDGAGVLKSVLRTNKTLIRIDLKDNETVFSEAIDDEALSRIDTLLSANRALMLSSNAFFALWNRVERNVLNLGLLEREHIRQICLYIRDCGPLAPPLPSPTPPEEGDEETVIVLM